MPIPEGDPLVLVTGASGFIATHVIQQLQQQGYRVRGTVRSLSNETKVKPIRELCPDARVPVELVEADLMKDEGWEDAVKGCQFVLHTASPFPLSRPKHENEIIKPAIEGTLHVLNAVKKVGGVKRVVVTSSVVAVSSGHDSGTFNEETWSDLSKPLSAYNKSKTMAEKAAWDFMKDHEASELAVVNPCLVLGPALCGSPGTSMNIMKLIMERQQSSVPNINIPIVDVRDVALAHIRAMTVPEAAGYRHLLAYETLAFSDISEICAEEFKPQGYNPPTGKTPNCCIICFGPCNPEAREIKPELGKLKIISNTRMKNVLGIEPRNSRSMILDMAYDMIEKGYIKKTAQYKGRPQNR